VANQVGAQLTQQLQESGMTAWIPGVMLSVRCYFAVTHVYVRNKLLLLLCPFLKRDNHPTYDAGNVSDDSTTSFITDVSKPDLYIPLMGYVTYVLLYGLTRGTVGEFDPEILGATASFAGILLFLEVLGAKLGFYISGASNISFLDLTCYGGYKYVALSLQVMLGLLTGGGMLYWAAFLYLAGAAAFATYECLRKVPVHVRSEEVLKLVIFGFAGCQVLLCWLLVPSLVGKKVPVVPSGVGAGSILEA